MSHRETKERQEEESFVKTEAKVGVMCLQAKASRDCQQPPGAVRGKEGLSPRLQGECSSTDTLVLDFWTREL